ncbi:charged multivesicular body protein 6-A isoform X1 [Aphis craccivora]|uniref:Charged multivesicular body protein 6-A isoform X1 n=1 Tax=Aphis craccivora TaxID=307492 RepID=A0A6G0W3W5_APHCR|nr:charged multivesicular body protein 6-A isoform X1 [Aphis craccivora]
MGMLFGKPKVSRITDHDRAVLQMKQQRDTLKRYQQRVEKLLESERELAKRLLSENKRDKAKLLLRKKKYQTEQLERTEASLDTIEKLIQDLEYTQIETKVIEGLKIGNVALKKANELFNIEHIEQLLDETKEGIDKQREITDLLSGALSSEDEEAVEAELNELIIVEHQKAMDNLPIVPSDELPVTIPETKEKDNLPTKKIALEAQ